MDTDLLSNRPYRHPEGHKSNEETIVATSWAHVALSQIYLIIIDKFSPVASKLGYAYLKPWFQVAIVVYDSCSFNFLLANIWIVAKSQDMPRSIKGKCTLPKGYQTRWQGTQLPQLSVMILQAKQPFRLIANTSVIICKWMFGKQEFKHELCPIDLSPDLLPEYPHLDFIRFRQGRNMFLATFGMVIVCNMYAFWITTLGLNFQLTRCQITTVLLKRWSKH